MMNISKFELFACIQLALPILVPAQVNSWTDLHMPESGLVQSFCTTPKGALLAGTSRGSIYRSVNNGKSWQYSGGEMPNGISKLLTVDSLILVGSFSKPSGLADCYPSGCGGYPNLLAFSRDDGFTWNSLGISDPRAFAYLSQVIYVATDKFIYTCDLSTKACTPHPHTFTDPAVLTGQWRSLTIPTRYGYQLYADLNGQLYAADIRPPMPDTLHWKPVLSEVLEVSAISYAVLASTRNGLFKVPLFLNMQPQFISTNRFERLHQGVGILYATSQGQLMSSVDDGSSWKTITANITMDPKALWSLGSDIFIGGQTPAIQHWNGKNLINGAPGIHGYSVEKILLWRDKIVTTIPSGNFLVKRLNDTSWISSPEKGDEGYTASPEVAAGRILSLNNHVVRALNENLMLADTILSVGRGTLNIFAQGKYLFNEGSVAPKPGDSLPGLFNSMHSFSICKEGAICYSTPYNALGQSSYIYQTVTNTLKAIAVQGDAFAVAYGDLYISLDAGKTWKTAAPSTPRKYIEQMVYLGNRLITSYVDYDQCKQSCIQSSDDYGATWYPPLAGTPRMGKIYALVSRPDRAFAGSDSGVFMTSDGKSWQKIGISGQVGAIKSLSVQGTILAAGTFGGDIFTTTLDPVSIKKNSAKSNHTPRNFSGLQEGLIHSNGVWRKVNGRTTK